ncbi:flagellar biosynthetic protein FliO [Thermomicrobiaceae bacterium CFH 74404]|uniref:Flagellar biosynthetic protein FliO n=1 Tax=Thermalbibacter longus TaxID=2951981 RepID=A0AA42BA13_9BACT|nr:flagellar biosynthetic protein FliO [Thermalbibacter longus]MCM8749311.1 flagellar biosynthetic protein FliO [Thermalbibacter longus]
MWRQWPNVPGRWRGADRLGRTPGRWIALAGLLVVALLAGQLLAGLRGAGESPSPPPTAGNDGTTFLAEGYAQLEDSDDRFSSAPSAWEIMGSMVVPLIVVIAGAYAAIRGLRYLNRRMAVSASTSDLLEVIDTLPLGGSGVLHVVRIGERAVVIGAGGAGISLIAELEPEEARALLARRATQPGGAPGMTSVLPRFRDVLATRIPHSWSILDTAVPEHEGRLAQGLGHRGDPRETGTESATGTPPRVAQQPATQPSFGYRPDRPAG